MDFWDLVKVMWRRWYITAPMLLVTAVGAGWIGVTVGPEYQATGHVAVVPSEVHRNLEANQVSRVNPWNVEALAHAASIRLTSARLQDELAAAGYAGEWGVEVSGSLPVVTVEVVAPTAGQAIETMHRLQGVVEEEVRNRQAEYNIPEEERIMTVRYDQGESVQTTASRLRRTLVAAVGAGIILTTGSVIAFDAVARWRRSKAQVPQPAVPADEPRRRYAYGVGSPAAPVNGTAATPPPGEFPLPVRLTAEPATTAHPAPGNDPGPPPAAKAATAPPEPGGSERSAKDDSTVVLPLSNVPWAGRPNGSRSASGPDDQDRSPGTGRH